MMDITKYLKNYVSQKKVRPAKKEAEILIIQKLLILIILKVVKL